MGAGPPADTEAAIMAATRRALAEHGHAGLSMARIAEGFEGSQSLLHYHYDTKDGLLAAFVAHERERVAEEFAALPEDPAERLAALLDRLVEDVEGGRETATWDGTPDEAPDPEATDVRTAYAELHAHAPHSDALRAELVAFEDLLFDAVRDAVADCVAAGVLDPVDPDRAATTVLAAHDSAFVGSLLGVDRDLRAAVEAAVLPGWER